MKWDIEFTQEAKKDLIGLDNSQQIQVLKAIRKVSGNPLPTSEGGHGKPLGNRMSGKLAGYLKIKLQKIGLRVVYCLVRNVNVMRIIIISVRDDETVYKLAQKRIQ
ncbi:MAG: type II toxin-antitoxin system RelE/ParE family toxin [Chloroflexi bacterium]|nr:type II toxin-antitoxin system RelE/ParE family toxin [Chloroflexota bacterium]